MSRQDQRVSGGATALQADGNITINQGISPSQMVEIIQSVTEITAKLTEQAMLVAQRRNEEFRIALVEEFSKVDSVGNREAFSDVDFQWSVRNASIGYSRKGGKELAEDLVAILVEKSKYSATSRQSAVLSRAIELASDMTSEEYSVLSILLLVKHVQLSSSTPQGVGDFIKGCFEKYIETLPETFFSLDFLESVGCIVNSRAFNQDLWILLHAQLGHCFSDEITADDLQSIMRKVGVASNQNQVSIDIPNLPFIFEAKSETEVKINFPLMNESVFIGVLESMNIQGDLKEEMLRIYKLKQITPEKFRELIVGSYPFMAELERKWKNSQLPLCNLTAVGKALGYSSLSGKPEFVASLDIWVGS